MEEILKQKIKKAENKLYSDECLKEYREGVVNMAFNLAKEYSGQQNKALLDEIERLKSELKAADSVNEQIIQSINDYINCPVVDKNYAMVQLKKLLPNQPK